MIVRQLIGLAAVLAFSTIAIADGPRLDGNWEVYMEMRTADSPEGGGTRLMTTHCVSKEAAKDPIHILPEANATGCKVSNYKVAGNKVTWDMACDGPPMMTSSVEFNYDGDTYQGTMNMKTTRGGIPADVLMKYEGKRMGDCTE